MSNEKEYREIFIDYDKEEEVYVKLTKKGSATIESIVHTAFIYSAVEDYMKDEIQLLEQKS